MVTRNVYGRVLLHSPAVVMMTAVAAGVTDVAPVQSPRVAAGESVDQGHECSSERGGVGVEEGEDNERVSRLSGIVDTVDEGEGVECEVDEWEPEEGQYLCLDPLSLELSLFVIETCPAMDVSPHLHRHCYGHDACDKQQEIEGNVPQDKLEDLPEPVALAVLVHRSNAAPAARRPVRVT